MVQVVDGVEGLSVDNVSLYYTTDPQLSNLPLLVFHGASTTTNSTLNSSRIQVHVFSATGFQSYPRLTISPNSPFYSAVYYLPRDRQGDEICRGLAFGLLKYFKDLPEIVKTALIDQSSLSRGRRPLSPSPLFSEQHAANLASTMTKVENIEEVLQDIEAALAPQTVSNIDIDLVLPPGSITPIREECENIIDDDDDDDSGFDPSLQQYGKYAPLVKLFGETSFLPTSNLRRAPSKPTALNRTRSFLKDQKMSLRREMGELIDTEERYVIKIHELVNHIADGFRVKAKDRPFGSLSPSEKDLQKLFPSSLDKILQVNSAFLTAIRKVMDETEEEAMQDLEASQESFRNGRYGNSGRLNDPTGALTFAKVLLEWFPQFSDCYQEYIRASQDFPQIITSFVKELSSFSRRVQQTGEQRLRSAIIEPVQRLPRYSLFIDNIVSFLPMTHPALQPMLKARDIITNICSLDPPALDKNQVINRLLNVVEMWPSNLVPQGRLISAVDFVELSAPYHMSGNLCRLSPGILLLFADSVIVLRKAKDCKLTARGVMAEVDKPSAATMMAPMTAAAGGQQYVYELSFSESYALGEIRFTESSNGQATWMSSQRLSRSGGFGRGQSPAITRRAFFLEGAYGGKASRWTEEVIKAKVEGRFSEKEREADKWCLRNVNLKENSLNIYTAVYEEGIDTLIEGRKEPAPVRIVVDHEKGTKGAPVGHYGIEIVANVSAEVSGNYGLEVDGLNNKTFINTVDVTTFMPVFAKRVGDLLHAQYVAGNPALTMAFISNYSAILRSLRIQLESDKFKSLRPSSPVKLLSSFLSGGGSSYSTPSTSKSSRTPMIGNVPSMPPPALARSSSQKTEGESDGKHTRPAVEEIRPSNPLVRLEETFTSYMASLHSRKRNVFGKVLRNRASADELSVNALYNTLIENPFDTRSASEVSIDVLFTAFEKFLRIAWMNQMGPVVTLQTLQSLREKSLKLFPGDFADYIKLLFGDMAPQNRRAFVAIVKLLADLLDGCGNDGDRGALTAVFAELLVTEGDPHEYINLLDCLVEDSERLFDDMGPSAGSEHATPMYGSVSSTTRSTLSANTGSITSNTSSFRKRLGFDTLLRQNSKSDSDGKGSMWRTLSRSHRNPATGEPTISSFSKASLAHSRSTDIDIRLETHSKRPASRDRPTVIGAFDNRPSSSDTMQSRLSTIGASPPPDEAINTKSLKNKRRSSLSDLKILVASTAIDSPSSIPRRQLPSTQKFDDSSPRTPSPTKPTANRTMMQRGPLQKENGPSFTRNFGSLTERPQNIMSDDIVKDPWSAGKSNYRTTSISNIPTLNGVVRDRTPSISPPPKPMMPPKGSPQKLRLQNAQKLRERLQNEAKEINAAEESLQSELSKIGVEMAKFNAGRTAHTNPAYLQRLSDSVKSLESKIPGVINDFTSRNDAVKRELETSLQASEYKVKGLDQLYKEASAENELLYEKFNGELGKIVKALKGKGKEDKEDLIIKTKEAMEEAAKVKKENARLRREILSLRTLLKGNV